MESMPAALVPVYLEKKQSLLKEVYLLQSQKAFYKRDMKLHHSHLLQVVAAANQEGLGNDTVHS